MLLEMRSSTVSIRTIDHTKDSLYNLDFLRQQARWIRDELDPQIAREGPDTLHSDEVLGLDELLRRLFVSDLRIEDVRSSGLYRAIIAISGKATRWPGKLIEKSDTLSQQWEEKFGTPLKDLRPLLFERGGRLHGICQEDDLNRDKLMSKWLRMPNCKLIPTRARKFGNLGFTPGDWWISSLFAFYDGIIDFADTRGSIVADMNGAYAIVMTSDTEICSASPETFTYRTKNSDVGRYRLTAATSESRQPVRILRSHSLRSFWAPRAGLRYDGLHTVVGWAIRRDPDTTEIVYEIKFERLKTEVSMDSVLVRPFSDEVDDYQEYKRCRQDLRKRQPLLGGSQSPTNTDVIAHH